MNNGEKSRIRQSQKWLKIHELKVLKVYKQIDINRLNGRDQNKLFEELAQDKVFLKAGISKSSIKMKCQNLRYLDIGNGLSHASQLNGKVFKKYGHFSIEELEKKIEGCK